MGLKTVVKVSEINNLSDARYCAGMGVEMVGFSLDENHPKFIELAKLREIAIWISGVKVVGEFTGENVENINYLSHELKLDYVQLNHPIKPELIVHLKKPIIQKLNLSEYSLQETEIFLNQYKNYVQYFLLENDQNNSLDTLTSSLINWCSNYPIILGIGIKNENLNMILNEIKPAGIELRGGNEIKPGLKTFDELSSILESLEIED